MKARNLLVMFLVLFATTLPTMGQTARDVISARIRSHISSSVSLSANNQQSSESEETSSEESSSLLPSYGPNDLWLEINLETNNLTLADLTLHGTWATNVYQLQSRADLFQTNWIYGEILLGPNDGDSFFTPVGVTTQAYWFFRAEQASAAVEVSAVENAVEPPATHTGVFHLLRRTASFVNPLTVYYTISGSATLGVDYTDIPSSVTFAAGESDTNIYIQPLADNEIEFEESVILTLIRTNGYVVDPANESATVWIQDNLTNVFEVVMTNLWLVGMDYHPGTNALIVSTYPGIGTPTPRFLQIRTNIVFTNGNFVTNTIIANWTTNADIFDEVKLAIVKNTSNGFTQGDMYYGTGGDGQIGWASADGNFFNSDWKDLTNETSETLFRGGFYIDDSGSFGGDLIAVTGGGQAQGGEVWRINSQTNATRLANLSTNLLKPHLEGVVTLTNDPTRWGPWAGKIITGAESELPPKIISISTNGQVGYFFLGICPEDFDVVPQNEDLYCTDQQQGLILKISRNLLTNFWGDLLITQEGFGNPSLNFVHWTGSNFVTRRLSYTNLMEHSTFAPIDIPPLYP